MRIGSSHDTGAPEGASTSDGPVALRLDDVGAASKRHEVYGITRIPLGSRRVPFPGNFLFLKYLPPIKRWGPYRELSANEWEAMLTALEIAGARMTTAITAGWVEADGGIVPFPTKFRDAAGIIREGVHRRLLEVANHGYTHCLVAEGRYRPRWFGGNREFHREFYPSLPAGVHRDHLARAQAILTEYFGVPVLTFVPPGNVFCEATLEAAAEVGIRYVSCRDARRFGDLHGIVAVDDGAVVAIHDRDVVRDGLVAFRRLLGATPKPFVTVRDLGEARARGA